MAVREEMRTLIGRLRLEIGDAGAPPVFTDEQLQDALDAHAFEVRYARTDARPTYTAGNVSPAQFVDHRAPRGFFDDAVQLLDGQFNVLTLSSRDNLNARWRLAASQIVVLILGFQYDLFAAAGDIFDEWAAKVATETDWHDGRVQSFDSQKHDHFEKRAKAARRKAWPVVRKLVTDEIAGC
jgi:hypothetical protein